MDLEGHKEPTNSELGNPKPLIVNLKCMNDGNNNNTW